MPEARSLQLVVGVAATTSLLVSLGAVFLLGQTAVPERDVQSLPGADRGAREQLAAELTAESTDLAALRDAHERERSARLRMAGQIDQLRKELAELLGEASEGAQRVGRASGSNRRKGDAQQAGGEVASEFAELWFSEQALFDLGMSENETEALRRRFDEAELEKLEARDRALREGWSSSSRHSRELREIRSRFHEEIGDENYDRVLYASGRDNRVRVQDLLRGSAAETSGVEVGDVIVSYAGRRVFDPTMLYIWTTQGDFGESIELEVLRSDEIIRLVVPRGPLGGNMTRFAAAPGS